MTFCSPRRWDIWLALLSIGVFIGFPTLDLKISGLFYSSQQGFWLKEHLFNQLIRYVFGYSYLLWLALLIGLAIYYQRRGWYACRKKCIFLILAMLIGPGLIVNALIKNNSTGRARPAQVIEFGGQHAFTPPFQYAGVCHRDCSFVSGHAAIGFYTMALGWVLASRAFLFAGIALGGLISFSRIMEGAHFFSDTLFAFWVVYFCTAGLAWYFGYSYPGRSTSQGDAYERDSTLQ